MSLTAPDLEEFPLPVRRALPGAPLPGAGPLRHEVSAPLRWGLAAIVLFFGLGGGWAATARLGSAVIGAGVVAPESKRFTIQHLEGGIIRDISVKEGDHVSVGDTLLVLDELADRADLATLRDRLATAAAEEARLVAEQDGAEAISFSHPVFVVNPTDEALAARRLEEERFRTRRANLANESAILQRRIEQWQAQIDGLTTQLKGVREQGALLEEELSTAEPLLERGLTNLPRVLALKSRLADRLATEGALVSDMARSNEAIEELRLQMLNLKVEKRDEVDANLTLARSKRSELEKQIRKIEDRLTRTTIRSPVAGTVLSINFKTLTGVVRPGEPIMEIVPGEEKLLVSANISPRHVDEIAVGMSATVMFPSYSYRTLLQTEGEVTSISPDAIHDQVSGDSYFVATVEVDREELAREAPQIRLTPGLPAEVFIATGERTVLEYLIQPLEMVITRSMRET